MGHDGGRGIVRKIDHLGPFAQPMELRRLFNTGEKGSLEILVNGNQIVLREYELTCMVCGANDGGHQLSGKNVCPACWAAIGTPP